MAWLETKGSLFHIRFRFGGAKLFVRLDTKSEREAQECLIRFEEHFRLFRRGMIPAPAENDDPGIYILSGGKLSGRPGDTPIPVQVTIGKLFQSYRDGFPRAVKEESTLATERVHLKHLERLLGTDTPVASLTAKSLQAYADARAAEKGQNGQTIRSDTVKKELGTFAFVWNHWAVPEGVVTGPAPTSRIHLGKRRGKPPFQTRDQIERQIARGKLSPTEAGLLWQSLFLTLTEIEEVLDFVQARKGPAYVYAMFVMAAHTGARRSEIMRSRIDDFDLVGSNVMIREKKKESDKEETYRTVPLTPRLTEAMRNWFTVHPGGIHAFAVRNGRPITKQWAAELFETVFARTKWSVLSGWHCFRHSFITNCAAKAIDQRLIDHWVGHTTEAMRRRYSHLVPGVSRAALESVFGMK